MLTGPLPDMAPRHTPVTLGKRGSQSLEEQLGFSMTSVLNQRPTEILPSGLSDSRMNARYTKRTKAPVPPVSNGHVPNAITNGHISTIDEDQEENFEDSFTDLSKKTKLNVRYLPNGEINIQEYTNNDLSKATKLNNRYSKSNNISRGKSGVPDHIRRKQSMREDEAKSEASDHTDWSHLVEDIFNNALNDHEEQDGQRLGSRIKGGGKGVPGLQQAPVSI